MIRNIFIFVGTFIAGAVIALVARAAMFKPHAGHEGHPASGAEYAAMVSNPLAPATSNRAAGSTATGHEHAAAAQPTSDDRKVSTQSAQAGAAKAKAEDTGAGMKPVNTICAICGMPVDPSLPTL